MGPEERRSREKRRLRLAILDAAEAIAVEQGWPRVTLRKIAQRIEYSPAAVYEYFESKDAIVAELLRSGFDSLAEEFASVSASSEHPTLELARATWRFALDRPQVYQVMHGLAGVPFTEDEPPTEAKRVFQLLLNVLARARPHASTQELEDLADTLWALLHGFISLYMAGRLAGGKKRAIGLSERAVGVLMAGGTAARSHSKPLAAEVTRS